MRGNSCRHWSWAHMDNHIFRKPGLLSYALAGGVGLMVLTSGAAWAVWCGTSECSSCGSHGWSKREECRFDSQSACNSEIDRIRREMQVAAAVYTCYEKGTDSSTYGNADLISKSTEGVVRGITSGDAALTGMGLLGIGTAALVQGMQSDPAADTQRAQEAAQAAAQQRQAEDQRRAEEQARKQDEERKDRLLGSMMSVDDSSQLGLMGVDSGPGLGLMTGDQTISASSSTTRPSRPADDDAGSLPKSAGFDQGYSDASQCYSQNSGSRCAGVAVDQQRTCLADYRAGYAVGEKQRARLMREAKQIGQLAGGRGELANGASNPLANGPCRVEWIEAYNQGYFQGKHAKVQKK